MPQHVKELYLAHLVGRMVEDGVRSMVVFVGPAERAELLARLLAELGVDAAALHGKKPQPARMAALDRFRSGLTRILLATDVASRGLDIPTVDLARFIVSSPLTLFIAWANVFPHWSSAGSATSPPGLSGRF